jgi:hypothetical protein
MPDDPKLTNFQEDVGIFSQDFHKIKKLATNPMSYLVHSALVGIEQKNAEISARIKLASNDDIWWWFYHIAKVRDFNSPQLNDNADRSIHSAQSPTEKCTEPELQSATTEQVVRYSSRLGTPRSIPLKHRRPQSFARNKQHSVLRRTRRHSSYERTVSRVCSRDTGRNLSA